MIEISGVSKKFGDIYALDNANCEVATGSIFGLVGSNGAGKSTLLRMIAGVYSQESGEIKIDGKPVYDSPDTKKECVFVSDSPYLPHGATLNSMAKMYSLFYNTFSQEEYGKLVNIFGLNPKEQLSNFSKGMRRQAVIILALSCRCKYIIMDETLDGLDPVMRGLVKRLLYESVLDNNSTVVLSSHSLRELEDVCDNLAMIHKGRVIFQRDIESIGSQVSKIQVVMDDDIKKQDLGDVEVLNYSRRGSVSVLIVRGESDKAIEFLKEKEPILMEVLPLSLEEVFTYELKERGYFFDNIFGTDGEGYEE